jgi:hypothetical protein
MHEHALWKRATKYQQYEGWAIKFYLAANGFLSQWQIPGELREKDSAVLTSWSWALIEKPSVVQLLKKFPAFYGTQRFITLFTRALHWSLSWATSIQFIPSHPISLRSKYYPPTYVLFFLVVFFLLTSHEYPTCIPLLPHSCYMLCSSHPPWLHYSNYTWRREQVMKLLIMQSSLTSHHFISLRSKYSPEHSVLKQPQSMFLP